MRDGCAMLCLLHFSQTDRFSSPMPLWLSGFARIETGGWLGVSSNRIAPCLKNASQSPVISRVSVVMGRGKLTS